MLIILNRACALCLSNVEITCSITPWIEEFHSVQLLATVTTYYHMPVGKQSKMPNNCTESKIELYNNIYVALASLGWGICQFC